jgi:hypothetical protein
VIVAVPALVLRSAGATTRELMLALFTVLLVSATVLTLTGFMFRGPGFKLYLPWRMPDGYNTLDSL